MAAMEAAVVVAGLDAVAEIAKVTAEAEAGAAITKEAVAMVAEVADIPEIAILATADMEAVAARLTVEAAEGHRAVADILGVDEMELAVPLHMADKGMEEAAAEDMEIAAEAEVVLDVRLNTSVTTSKLGM
jgi:hypothetical protein